MVDAFLSGVLGAVVLALVLIARQQRNLTAAITQLRVEITAQKIATLTHRAPPAETPEDIPEPARRKRHLALYIGGGAVAAFTALGAWFRSIWRRHRAATATATAVTIAAAGTATALVLTAAPGTPPAPDVPKPPATASSASSDDNDARNPAADEAPAAYTNDDAATHPATGAPTSPPDRTPAAAPARTHTPPSTPGASPTATTPTPTGTTPGPDPATTTPTPTDSAPRPTDTPPGPDPTKTTPKPSNTAPGPDPAPDHGRTPPAYGRHDGRNDESHGHRHNRDGRASTSPLGQEEPREGPVSGAPLQRLRLPEWGDFASSEHWPS